MTLVDCDHSWDQDDDLTGDDVTHYPDDVTGMVTLGAHYHLS